MPPRQSKPKSKSKQLPIILKFKRQSQTIFIQFQQTSTLNQLKLSLFETINRSGGLKIVNDPIQLTDDGDPLDDDDDIDEDGQDIDIPKPSFDVNSDSDDDDDDDASDEEKKLKQTSTEKPTGKGKVKLENVDQLVLGLPSDKFDAYNCKILKITDDDYIEKKLQDLNLKDFDIIFFKLGNVDEDFKVYKPEVEE
ncbi:unnamed protein product [Ambrosiozyma monospora]|uniref:Unnamed protein product n=1 Tax=Ambrosiozyma monospora TaxID=43982 RepID=A0A9W6YS39_AMBMO|nr:unnamed protein product [Ambrosiozyma monospora]